MNYASDFLWHQERTALQNGGSLLIQRLLTVNRLENLKVQSHFLNNDILRYILVLLAQDLARSEKDPDWPWYTLSHVSRQWRTVALCTPAFWSSIVSKPLSRYMLHTQLLRSKSSNLSITFVDLNLVLAPCFRDVFRTQGSRITELYIRMTYDLFWLISFDFLHTNLLPPMLKVLHLELEEKNGYNHGEYVLIENILTLSELRSLSIRGLQTSVSPTLHIDNLPPLENLANFTAYEVDFDDITFKDIVRLFPNVENLSIEDCKIVYVSTRDDENNRSVDADEENASEDDGPHLPSLCTLKLHGIGSITALQIFHDLDLPPTSNWDIHCVVLSEYALGHPLHDHTFDLHMRILQTIFKRHRAAATDTDTDTDPTSKYENLSIIINNREFQFETLSLPALAESPDNSSSSSSTPNPNRKRPKEPIRIRTNTNVTMNYASSTWTNTLPDYLSSITHHITTTLESWRTARSLRFGIASAAVDGVRRYHQTCVDQPPKRV